MVEFKREFPRDGAGNKHIENGGEMHLPCAVLVDTSSSMSSVRSQLHQGLVDLGEALDDQARGRVEFCIIAFDDNARIIEPFGSVYDYEVPELDINGMTAMHDAVDFALGEIEARKAQYKENETGYYRPWIFLLTDGGANDEDNGAFERLLQAQKDKRCTFFPVAIGEEADKNLLKSMQVDGIVLTASKDNFKGAFVWLSSSLSKTSSSRPGEKVALDQPQVFQLEVESL